MPHPGSRAYRRNWRALGAMSMVLLARGCATASTPMTGGAGRTAATSRLAESPLVEELELRSDSVTAIRGWFLPGEEGAGAVLLLHGVRSSHRSMLGRARFLHDAGYAVLLIDFRGHGRSAGGPVTFGAHESRDAQAALAFLRWRLPNEPVAVIGASMGGAASLLGSGPLAADAFVLESVYATIEAAVFGRTHAWLGALGSGLGALYLRHWLPRSGVSPAELKPIDRIARVKAPVYVLSGTEDRYTSLEEARTLFQRAPTPREFWAVEGAGHEDLYAVAGSEYERRVLAFLARYVRGTRDRPRSGSGYAHVDRGGGSGIGP